MAYHCLRLDRYFLSSSFLDSVAFLTQISAFSFASVTMNKEQNSLIVLVFNHLKRAVSMDLKLNWIWVKKWRKSDNFLIDPYNLSKYTLCTLDPWWGGGRGGGKIRYLRFLIAFIPWGCEISQNLLDISLSSWGGTGWDFDSCSMSPPPFLDAVIYPRLQDC